MKGAVLSSSGEREREGSGRDSLAGGGGECQAPVKEK